MKFKLIEKIIVSGRYRYETLTPEKAQSLIKIDCKRFLNESKGKLLYRGINELRSIDGDKNCFLITLRKKNRKPTDTKFNVQQEIDNHFYEKFGWRPRKESFMATGDDSKAEYYGKVFQIYFIGRNYKYIWSPEVNDLYETASRSWHKTGKKEFQQVLLKTYRENNLAKAIESDNEIMIKCDSFIAIPA